MVLLPSQISFRSSKSVVRYEKLPLPDDFRQRTLSIRNPRPSKPNNSYMLRPTLVARQVKGATIWDFSNKNSGTAIENMLGNECVLPV